MKNRIIIISFSVMLCVACGCSKDKATSRNPESQSAQPLPELDKELSTVPGVSIIRRAEREDRSRSFSGRGDAGRINADHMPLFSVLGGCWPVENGEVRNEEALPDGVYDITVDPPAGKQGWDMLKEAVEKAFRVRIHQAKEPVDVHLLKRQEGKEPGMAKSGPDERYGCGTGQTSGGFGWKFTASTMGDLALVLKEYVNTPVFDETGLDGTYTFELAMDHWKPETVHQGLDKLGLKIEKAKRSLDVLRIEKANAATSTTAK